MRALAGFVHAKGVGFRFHARRYTRRWSMRARRTGNRAGSQARTSSVLCIDELSRTTWRSRAGQAHGPGPPVCRRWR